NPYTFSVTYRDERAIAAASLGTGDVRVTGPNGFQVSAQFVSVNVAGDGTPRIATYQFVPPGGSWDVADNGTYVVAVEPSQVANTLGNFVPAGQQGTFRVVQPGRFVVTTTADSGPGSLREVLSWANALPGPDVVEFDPVLFGSPQTITLSSGQLSVTDSTTIRGPGANLLAISGNNASRIFSIGSTAVPDVSVSGMLLTAGFVSGSGGAILSVGANLTIDSVRMTGNRVFGSGGALALQGTGGSLRLWNSQVLNNVAETGGFALAAGGGALLNRLIPVEIRGCTIDGNQAPNGGGVFAGNGGSGNPGTLTILGSTISNNRADNVGGGVNYPNTALILIRSSTISMNVAGIQGGGVYVSSIGPLTVENSTIVANQAPTGAGLDYEAVNNGLPLTITSSIISGNVGTVGPDVNARIAQTTATRSAIGNSNGFTLTPASGNNLPYGDNLLLGPLADNGGPTKTQALPSTSPAVDAGSNPAGLGNDQRGLGFPRTAGAAPDIGAFEYVAPGTPTAAAGPLPDVTNGGGTAYVFTVTFRDDTAVGVASLGNGDVRVTGPNGLSALPQFVSVDANANGSPRAATYRLTPPGGTWDFADTGTYFVDVEAGQVADSAGNFIPPQRLGQFAAIPPIAVTAVKVNDGSAQRSRVSSLTVSFDGTLQFVGAAADAFSLRRSDGLVIGLIASVDNTGGRTTVTLTFTGTGLEANSLADGNYALVIFGAAARSGPSGPPLDADGDGLPGGDLTYQFHRLFGDVNGDKSVNGLDLTAFRSAFGTAIGDATYNAAFDVNGDGIINGLDLTAFRIRFGAILP
ncbi:MAG TPA: choice-of-anchor Q domain-containing protein, partial [Gemmataceae bacterium]|nr:choice-of-anchor Q domain-containing protein [Gemmataceae bacterium]